MVLDAENDVGQVENETKGDQADETVGGQIVDEDERREGFIRASHSSREQR